jgi:hypothetical protein
MSTLSFPPRKAFGRFRRDWANRASPEKLPRHPAIHHNYAQKVANFDRIATPPAPFGALLVTLPRFSDGGGFNVKSAHGARS